MSPGGVLTAVGFHDIGLDQTGDVDPRPWSAHWDKRRRPG
jgi:hypothetical protein